MTTTKPRLTYKRNTMIHKQIIELRHKINADNLNQVLSPPTISGLETETASAEGKRQVKEVNKENDTKRKKGVGKINNHKNNTYTNTSIHSAEINK